MILLSSFLEHVGRLVHADVRAVELDAARHRAFIATRLGLFFAAMAIVPIALALGHVPAPWEAGAAVWLCVPLAAAAAVSRKGCLRAAEVACVVAWIGFAFTTTALGGTSPAGGCVLLLIAPLEAALSTDAMLIRRSAAAALAGALLMGAADLRVAHGVAGAADAAILAPALVYILALAVTAAALQALQQRQHAAGEERYRVLAAATGDLVIRYDRAGGVLLAGREAEAMFGLDPRELLGRGFFERVHVADRPAFMKLFGDAADSGENVAARLRLRTAAKATGSGRPDDPVFVWIEVRARRFEPVDARRRPGGESTIVAIVRDVTAQANHEAAMAEARAQAERASAWKDSFLANVSHELRTPLNAIIGFSEMLSNADLSPRDPEKQREYAHIITTSGHHLLSVVNSLLDISKIEAGRFEINPEPFGLLAMIESCCDMVGLKAEQAGIAIRRQLEPLADEVIGDKRACKQIVINLLSNAIKFTPRGGQVTITARPQGTAVLISVADTGVGIAPRDLGRLGDAFFQGRAGLDRPYEGTGLGLSVVRGFVGLHGGSIAVESALGEGTRVMVRLPLDCRGAAQAAASARIEIIPRSARSPLLASPSPKVQKIA